MKRRSAVVAALVTTAITAFVISTHALTVTDAAGLGVLAYATWLVTRPYSRTDVRWPKAPRHERAGGRADVAELSWTAFTRNGMVTERVLRRVRHIAARRLAAHGVLWDGSLPPYTFDDGPPDLDAARRNLRGWGTGPDDAAEHKARARELLGSELVDSLSTAHAAPPRTLDHWFSALDDLVAAPDDSRSPR